MNTGTLTSAAKVMRISANGFCLQVAGREHFVDYDLFPFFRGASAEVVCDVQLPTPTHLYWPLLDVDLALESLDHPEHFPLVSRTC